MPSSCMSFYFWLALVFYSTIVPSAPLTLLVLWCIFLCLKQCTISFRQSSFIPSGLVLIFPSTSLSAIGMHLLSLGIILFLAVHKPFVFIAPSSPVRYPRFSLTVWANLCSVSCATLISISFSFASASSVGLVLTWSLSHSAVLSGTIYLTKWIYLPWMAKFYRTIGTTLSQKWNHCLMHHSRVTGQCGSSFSTRLFYLSDKANFVGQIMQG